MKKKPGPIKGTKHTEIERSQFAKNLIAYRKKRGLSQIELAQKVGLTQRMISHYERSAEGPSPELLKKFAKSLNVTADQLMGLKNESIQIPNISRALQKRLEQIESFSIKGKKAIQDMIDMIAKAEGK